MFINTRDNDVFRSGSLIAIVNTDHIEDYISSVPIIVLNKQSLLILTTNHSPITM